MLMSSRAWTREEIEKFATEKQRNTRRRGRLVRFGNGSFDPSYRNVHFGTMVKTRLLSLCFSNRPFQIYFSSFFQPPSFCPPYFCSRHFSTFRIGSSGSGFPDVERSAPCRFFVRINCNTLRIGLIDRSRERERERRNLSDEKRKGGKKGRDCKRQEVSCRFYRINNATSFFENRCRITDY